MIGTSRKPRHTPAATRLAIALVIALGACEPRLDTHGFMPNPELIAQIEPGVQDKAEVAEVLGTPSTVATFDQSIWYYITQQSRRFAFFKPEIVDQQVLVVKFDDADVVSEVNRYTIEDGLIVDPVTRKTPTVGKELTLLQQLFGNIGRFAK
jgi:outer membrane protein assembly factor BamE (lipoprotein component of BamABCDE complex)